MAKKNPGKDFENDIAKSSEKRGIFCYRLRDQAASFNQADSKLRFSIRNICDFIMYQYPYAYLVECKSHLGSSIPFTALKSKEKDHRIRDMAMESITCSGLQACVLFNWRDHDNETVSVYASLVDDYIKSEGKLFGDNRKSIPYQWTIDHGRVISHRLKKVHYDYDMMDIIFSKYDPEMQPQNKRKESFR